MLKTKIKKTLYSIRTNKRNNKRLLQIALALFLTAVLPALIINTVDAITDEVLVGIASLVVTALSAIYVVFQLKDSENVTCCDMLSKMNLSFIGNKRLMLLYQRLEECYRNPTETLVVKDDDDNSHIHTSDLVAYFTFFEVLNEYVKHKIVTIAQLDDLFGYRFFIFVHNKYIQERELYAVPSSYVNIFQLYNLWIEYRKINVTDKQSRLVIMQKNQIPEYYLKKKIYLEERMYNDFIQETVTLKGKDTKQFELKTLFPSDLKEILELQRKVVSALDDKNIFQPSTENEFLESMLVDCCCGLYHNNKLVALAVIVLNRKSPRNLCSDCECLRNNEPFWDCVTFDSVQVDPDFRGYGIQNYFIELADKIALKTNAKYIAATVSPDNPYSLNNFQKNGYVYARNKNNPYKKYGSKRILLKKDIK